MNTRATSLGYFELNKRLTPLLEPIGFQSERLRPNRSLEWTSTSWPRYAHQFMIAARGQLVPAPQLQR